MARIGKYNIGFNKAMNVGSILMSLFMLILWLGVGDILIDAANTFVTFNDSTNKFYKTYEVLGLVGTTNSGLVSIIGILLAIGIVVQVFKVTRLN